VAPSYPLLNRDLLTTQVAGLLVIVLTWVKVGWAEGVSKMGEPGKTSKEYAAYDEEQPKRYSG